MMTYKFKINQVREVLGMEIKLEEAKLVDGVTVIEYEKLEPGFPVFVIAEDGTTKTPALAGEYTLENGTIIELDEQGLIMEISSQEEDATTEEAPVAEDTVVEVAGAAEGEQPKVDVAMEGPIADAIEAKINEKMKMVFEVVEDVAKEVATIKEEMGAIKTKMEKFAKAPAAAAAPRVTEVTPEKFDSIDSKIEFLKNLNK